MKLNKFNADDYPFLDNVDVYNYDISYDPKLWTKNTTIKILRVNWDRDYSNVVYFDTEEKRDKWIDNNTKETLTLETEQYLQADGLIKIPLPFNVASKYNYLCVEFPDAPIDMGDDGIKRFFYFMDSVERNAASTTTVRLTPDYWTTYINETNINYMMLERGHAPLESAPSPENYLKDPLNNSRMLLTPDVNYGSMSERAKTVGSYVFNSDNMYAVFISTADVDSVHWGTIKTDSMRIPGLVYEGGTGCYNYNYIAVPVADLASFLTDSLVELPYFYESVQGMFYISSKLITLYSSFTFCGHTVYKVKANNAIHDILQLNKEMFNYDKKYANLTKLYTSPYAYITISDENGNQNRINIEEVGKDGKVQAYTAANLLTPSLNINAHIVNIGDHNIQDIVYAQTEFLSTKIGGQWETLQNNWSIPVFAIFEDQLWRQIWMRYWQNKQAEVSYNTSYAASMDSGNTNYGITERSINNSYDNTITSSNNTLSNLTIQNNNIKETNKLQNVANLYSNAVQLKANKEIYESGVDLQIATSWGSIATGTVGGALSLGTAGMSAGPVGAVVGAAGGALIGAASTSFNSTNILTNNEKVYKANFLNLTTQTEIMNGDAEGGTIFGIPVSSDNDGIAKIITNKNIATNSSTTNNNVNTANSIALSSKNVSHENNVASGDLIGRNAQRTKDVAISAVNTGQSGATLSAPAQHGSMTNTQTALSKPMGLFASLHIQNDSAIAQAGDQFCRYGYTYNGVWEMSKLQVMKYFTYWKAEDIWVNCCRPAIEDAGEMITQIFKNGVTVWSDPSKIGSVSIYENLE